jgi:superfamily II DNA or RNA helicase
MRSLPQIEAQITKLRPKPRPGQEQVLTKLADCGSKLNIKLPTGYGKTYTALACYSVLKMLGEVNRLLVIFPTDAQLLQFEESTPLKFSEYEIEGPKKVCDVRFFGSQAIRQHQKNECQVFGITVQSLIGSRGMDNIATMLERGRWMIVVDEYHHYGIDKPFGAAVAALNHEFLLCMSATSYRPGDDSAFGPPDIEVSYLDAEEEQAVKPLCGHAYHYKIDAIDDGNEVISFTTDELYKAAGDESAKAIEKLLIDRKLRWSPKYISPLITNPIDRMLSQRLKTGFRLQAIVGAMCVSHAELVCDQIRSTFPDLKVDWVGTGCNGRTPEQNKKIIRQFAPTDGSDHSLDILVHVGMAGEGLDTVYVSEVIHLNAANVNNTNNQENGRAARYLPGVDGHINFDACSGFAIRGYVGRAIMHAMDCNPPGDHGDDDDEQGPGGTDIDWTELPPEPTIRIVDVECISIDSGDETVKKMASWMVDNVKGWTKDDLKNPDCEVWKHAIEGTKRMRQQEADECNEKSRVKQWQESLERALTIVTSNVVKATSKPDSRQQNSLRSDIRKRINTKKKAEIGGVQNSIESYQSHYQWVTKLNEFIVRTKEVPLWLS